MSKTHRDKDFFLIRRCNNPENIEWNVEQGFITKEKGEELRLLLQEYNVIGKRFLILNKQDRKPNYNPFKQRSAQRRWANKKHRKREKRREKRAIKHQVEMMVDAELNDLNEES